ncbi:YccT family protein [Vibrio cortegadensis]|uniref:DUF2057 family protein n=1 Tax=Vibrio cortegadensis TaxID=1328770 RepID=A0ABV4M7P8_9VIBR
MKIMFTVIAALISFSVSAANLSIPYNLKLHAVDNAEPVDDEVVPLGVGKHQLVVSFAEILKDGSKTRFYSSDPFVIEFNIATDDKHELKIPPVRRYRDAKKFFSQNSPNFSIVVNNDKLALEAEKFVPDSGFMPYGDMIEQVQKYNRERGNLYIAGNLTSVEAESVVALSDGNAVETTDTVIQLQIWYTRASKSERKEFRKWMIDQE